MSRHNKKRHPFRFCPDTPALDGNPLTGVFDNERKKFSELCVPSNRSKCFMKVLPRHKGNLVKWKQGILMVRVDEVKYRKCGYSSNKQRIPVYRDTIVEANEFDHVIYLLVQQKFLPVLFDFLLRRTATSDQAPQ
jgi:hypothetical protein